MLFKALKFLYTYISLVFVSLGSMLLYFIAVLFIVVVLMSVKCLLTFYPVTCIYNSVVLLRREQALDSTHEVMQMR